MKRLILVRHGDCSDDNHLSELGKRQMRLLYESLKARIAGNGDSITLLSSTADRAVQSAEIMGRMFGVENHPYDSLNTEYVPYDGDQILRLVVEHDKAETVIIVAHLEVCACFPIRFSSELGVNLDTQECSVRMGKAWLIDCEQRTIELIAPECF